MLEFNTGEWIPPLCRTVAISGEGIPELIKNLKKHKTYLETNGLLDKRRSERHEFALRELLKSHLIKDLDRFVKEDAEFKMLFSKVRIREISPYQAAEQLYQLILKHG